MGLARIDANELDEHTELTGTGQIMGTVDYMAPEQALDTKHADARADIYSLGATLNFLLTARPMLPGDTHGRKLQALLATTHEQTASLQAHRDDVGDELERIFQKMVARDPAVRYQTMAEVISDLQPLLPARDTDSSTRPAPSDSVTQAFGGGESLSDDLALKRFLEGQEVQTTAVAEPAALDVSAETIKSTAAEATELSPVTETYQQTQSVARRPGSKRPMWTVLSVLLIGSLIAAGVIFRVKTPDGVLLIEIPLEVAEDVTVEVDGERAEITDRDGKVISVEVARGRHEKLLVIVDGVRLLTDWDDGFEIDAGGELPIVARFERASPSVAGVIEVQLEDPMSTESLAIPSEHERNLARWVLEQGGSVKVRTEQVAQTRIHRLEDLPESDLSLAEIDLNQCEPLTDDDLQRIHSCPELSVLQLYGTDVGDAGLGYLEDLPNLRSINLGKTRVTESGLRELARFKSLMWVGLGDVAITPDALMVLEHFTRLFRLDIERLDISPEQLAALQVRIPNCFIAQNEESLPDDRWVAEWVIRIGGTVEIIDDSGDRHVHAQASELPADTFHVISIDLADNPTYMPETCYHVGVLERLEFLSLRGTESTDSTIAALSSYKGPRESIRELDFSRTLVSNLGRMHLPEVCPNLEILKLNDNRVWDNNSMEALSQLPALHTLELRRTNITDASVESLSKLNLRSLDISQTRITQEGVERLRQALPDCDIRYEPISEAPPNYALQFDGKDHEVRVDSLSYDGSHSITLEAWVTAQDHNVDGAVVSSGGPLRLKRDARSWGFTAFYEPERQLIQVSDVNIALNRRVHLATVYDGSALALFVDGRLQSQKPILMERNGEMVPLGDMTVALADWPQSESAGIGYTAPWEESPFRSIIDEVRISSIARYTEDFTPDERFEPDEDTLALYHFDEGEGEVLNDSSGNGHHGEIIGAQWVRVEADDTYTPVAPQNLALQFDGEGRLRRDSNTALRRDASGDDRGFRPSRRVEHWSGGRHRQLR